MRTNSGCRSAGTARFTMEVRLLRSTVALAGKRSRPLSLTAAFLPSGVLERGGVRAAHLVQDLRLVLICIARSLDRPLGVVHQLTHNRNKSLTFGGMLVGVQDQGGLSQGAQVAHDLGIGALPQLAFLRDRLFEF